MDALSIGLLLLGAWGGMLAAISALSALCLFKKRVYRIALIFMSMLFCIVDIGGALHRTSNDAWFFFGIAGAVLFAYIAYINYRILKAGE